ncbi:hypothetical protein GT037_005739 [Alternaria burnsii]|uniref:Uncharacterized protein n=1 Tax=Alternaria burnsii TaxID=1187904 RepID=A0A8H7EDY8_9PLEO|nr:uncharacterized protein GT037_005739 [Alternaria burnsii]KAF7676234.1 hypothetical protein GT037_005739 [Alternaria burnsii]
MDYILDNVGEWKNRLVNNSIKSFEDMTAQRWVRIIAIVGAYLLIRPYLLNAAAKKQKQQLEKEAEDLGLGKSEALDANDFRDMPLRYAFLRTRGSTAERFFPFSMGEELKIHLRFVQGIYVQRSAPKAYHSDTSEELVN